MTVTAIQPSSFPVALCVGVMTLCLGCAGAPPAKQAQSDRALAEATVAARTAFEQDRIDEAATFYAVALKRARALDRPSSIGDAAYSLAACLLRLHRYDRAQALLAEAGHELARGDAPLADVLLLQARAAYLAGEGPAATAFLHQLRTDAKSRPSASHLGQATLLEGQMACDRGDWTAAAELLQKARDILGPGADALVQAQLAALAGRVATGTHDLPAAAEAFDRQVDLLREARQYRALGSALAQAGEARAALDEYGPAADRFYRAARNAAAWGDIASAKKWGADALAAARRADDAVATHLTESLLSELEVARP